MTSVNCSKILKVKLIQGKCLTNTLAKNWLRKEVGIKILDKSIIQMVRTSPSRKELCSIVNCVLNGNAFKLLLIEHMGYFYR